MRHDLKQLLAFTVAFSPAVLIADNTDWMQLAASLLSNNQAGEAVSVLEPHMEAYAGELEYDFLLGQAALANNQANLAVFALERAILTAPEQDGARFTLAKAYASLGEVHQARKELGYIVKVSKNTRYKDLSNSMLSQLNNTTSAKYSLQFKAGFGSDSNANSATEKDNFLGLNLSANSQAKSSSVALAQLNGQFSYPLNQTFAFSAAADLYKYQYPGASFVNTTGFGINSALTYHINKNIQENIQLQSGRTEVDDRFNSQQISAQFSHSQKFNKSEAITASLRAGQTSYANSFSIKDISQLNAGVQYQNSTLIKDKDLLLTRVSVIAGKDDPIQTTSPYGRTYTGVQTGVVLGHRLGMMSVHGNISYVSSRYDTIFGMDRNENNMGASLMLNLKLGSRWLLTPGVNYIRNDSSIELYDFERTQLSVVVSHQII